MGHEYRGVISHSDWSAEFPARRSGLLLKVGGCRTTRKDKEWCQGIQQAFTSIAYPQSNGHAEATNREILRGLRARLNHVGGSWVDELQSVLWALRTTLKEVTGITSFQLVYGGEGLVPAEVGVESDQVQLYDEGNIEQRLVELDLMDELRDKATIQLMAYR
ncbi:uncharacterized protein LOC121972475 [Zingiber officinale]|uniref:uncharacterized protein LOC121972475 n=1 Tax=Zingiber officinale TaxID=94328 RepID=UPI001C4A8A14|nr:uncharacterized protein LOC121972475 [Zingiber officinale]